MMLPDVSKYYSLCIDQGNSSTKIAVFANDELLNFRAFENLDENCVAEIIDTYSIRHCILSSVTNEDVALSEFIKHKVEKFIFLDHQTPVPVEIRYDTPQTLGKDRLAAVVGASYLMPDKDLLVIDAGTAITYDFVDAKRIYHGGNIAPGVEMRLRALHEFTSKLPLVTAQMESPFLGTDTVSAIRSGVLYGIQFEINGYIDTLKIKYPELSVYLTGGSTFYFYTKLKSAIFAEKNLVLIGLNRILQFNV